MTQPMSKITAEDTSVHFVGSGALSYPWWTVVSTTGDALGADPAENWTIDLHAEGMSATYTLDHAGLKRAVNTLARLGKDKRPEYLSDETARECRAFINDPDDADFDADTADQVIQFALFGKVIFG